MMKPVRIFLAVAGLIFVSGCSGLPASLLAGGGSETSTPATTSAAETTKAAESSTAPKKAASDQTLGQLLGIGQYTTQQAGQAAFNPCAEISKEQLASLGLKEGANNPDDNIATYASCLLKMQQSQPDPVVSVSTVSNGFYCV